MHALQLTLRPLPGAKVDEGACSHAIYSLLATWRDSGQVVESDWAIAQSPDGYSVGVLCPEEGSLRAELSGEAGAAGVARLAEAGLAPPEARMLGRLLDAAELCACAGPPSYVLYTTLISQEPPLRCGGCFGYVPLYRVATEAGEGHAAVLRWQADYRACDALWIGSSVLEMAALRQLSHHDSALAKAGRAVCARIERATGAPTYYFAVRPVGRSQAGERRRRCPSCGGAWRLDETWHALFDFRCDACRLVSNIAWSIG